MMNFEIQKVPRPVFSQGVDWRFLLPMSENVKILLIGESLNSTVDGLKKVGIQAVAVDLFSTFSDLSTQAPASIDMIVVPHGISLLGSPGGINQFQFFQTVRRLLVQPGGVFMIGFSNSWIRHSDTSATRPRRIQKLLQQLGFFSMDLYGVYPDLKIPEYIMPIQPNILSFVFQIHWRDKIPEPLLRIFSSRLILKRLTDFLPCYFLIARI